MEAIPRETRESRRLVRWIWVALGLLFAVAAAYAWATDFITASGEWTVYTADCVGGTWKANRCLGRLDAGPRYRFRALRAHGEVLFWTVGSAEPSGRFTGCIIEGGRNWSCPPQPDAGRTVTLSMVRGHPIPDALHRTRPLHSLSKIRWIALRLGMTFGATANE